MICCMVDEGKILFSGDHEMTENYDITNMYEWRLLVDTRSKWCRSKSIARGTLFLQLSL